MLAANLYALVSTDPQALLNNSVAVGQNADEHLKFMLELTSGKALCAWGSFRPVVFRASKVLKMVREPLCLGTNADGQPKHPLYVSYNTKMSAYYQIVHKVEK